MYMNVMKLMTSDTQLLSNKHTMSVSDLLSEFQALKMSGITWNEPKFSFMNCFMNE